MALLFYLLVCPDVLESVQHCWPLNTTGTSTRALFLPRFLPALLFSTCSDPISLLTAYLLDFSVLFLKKSFGTYSQFFHTFSLSLHVSKPPFKVSLRPSLTESFWLSLITPPPLLKRDLSNFILYHYWQTSGHEDVIIHRFTSQHNFHGIVPFEFHRPAKTQTRVVDLPKGSLMPSFIVLTLANIEGYCFMILVIALYLIRTAQKIVQFVRQIK